MKKTTFIMLKPDAMEAGLENEILQVFKSEGIDVVRSKTVLIDAKLILTHYKEVIERVNIPDFPERIKREFVGKTVRVFELFSHSDDVVAKVRTIVGPTDPAKADKTTLRGRFGTDSMELAKTESRMVRNLIHASDSDESAEFEKTLWFNHTNQ